MVSIPRREVGILNATNIPLKFCLRPFNGTWEWFELQPSQWNIYNFADNITISTTTEESSYPLFVTYSLAAGHYYVLDMNFDSGYYDVFFDH